MTSDDLRAILRQPDPVVGMPIYGWEDLAYATLMSVETQRALLEAAADMADALDSLVEMEWEDDTDVRRIARGGLLALSTVPKP